MELIITILLCFSASMSLYLALSLCRLKNKKQLHYSFMFTMLMIFVWNLGYLAEIVVRNVTGKTEMAIVKFWFFGLIFLPPFFLLASITYLKTKVAIKKYLIIFLVPIISYCILLTNESHQLFFILFSVDNQKLIMGKYFPLHTIYSYACTVIGSIIFSYSAIKNSSIFSKQSLMIMISPLLPIVLNIVIILKLVSVPLHATSIAFFFTLILYYFAIIKLNILNIFPVALQKVVDKISDAFVVINEDLVVIDYNKPLISLFSEIANIRRNVHIKVVVPSMYEELFRAIEKVKREKQGFSVDKHIEKDDFNKYFKVEISPLYSSQHFVGVVILFKDITEIVTYVSVIKQNQRVLVEQEKYATLGYLVGGIAHNLKTPIMSIAGKSEAINGLATEIKDSIEQLDKNDYLEIASAMEQHVSKIVFYCSYMHDIITTVQGQITNNQTKDSFSIDELIKSVQALLMQEIRKNKCDLKVSCTIDPQSSIKGNITNMIQVINNIVLNSIHAYSSSSGDIELNVSTDKNNYLFTIRDYGKGIPQNVKDKLFNEMITTKGSKGTGLGLYISNTIVVGKFNGKINLDSKEGVGTTVNILIPKSV